MTMLRLRATLITAAALTGFACASAPAQDWPNRPVKIIAPFAAGGAADTLGRIIADHLSTAFHQQFFVENRGGAGGIVGAQAGAAAEPDGYTLVVSSIASNVISPVFNRQCRLRRAARLHPHRLSRRPARGHDRASLARREDLQGLRRARTEEQGAAELHLSRHGVAWLPGRRISGAAGELQGQPHSLQRRRPALTDLVAGHVKLGTMTFSSAAEQIRAGKVLALAVSTEKRIPNFPDIPTFREVGQDLVAATWFSLSGPAKLPNDIVQQSAVRPSRRCNCPRCRSGWRSTRSRPG